MQIRVVSIRNDPDLAAFCRGISHPFRPFAMTVNQLLLARILL
jgi:hypothetical protein